MDFKTRIKAMFMSRTQINYLINIFISSAIYGGFAATFTYQQIGLGTRFYSVNLVLGCIIGCIHAYMSADMRKKRWIFRHFRCIDLGETLFFTLTEVSFASIYFIGKFNPTENEVRVLQLFFCWNIFYRIVGSIINMIIPSIGDVFEQSLYKNQIDYQNHSNAENLMGCFGAAGGALLSLAIGDFIKWHPWLIFTLIILDWYGLWSRWQFYYNKENYSIIKRNFAKDSGEWKRKNKNS